MSAPHESPIPLADLALGASAVVTAVDSATAGAALARRLEDLGFLPATEVTAVRRAPLGDPTVYELRGVRMSMRRRDVGAVQVVPR